MANIERIDNSKAVIRVDVPVRVKRTGNIVEIRMMSRNTPVSYTHLDVYKRQREDRMNLNRFR